MFKTVFIPLATTFASIFLLPSIVHAAPWPQTAPAIGSIPITAPGASPVSAIEDAFKSIRTSKASTSDFSAKTAVLTTRNELLAGKCAPIIVIFARGTTEPGNVGDDVGPYFFNALAAKKPGKVIVQGVNNYKADVWGYLGGGSDSGATDMVNSVKKAAEQCQSSKIVLSGFSQGAQVVHKAAKQISTSIYPRISAIVLFGDPNNGDPFPGSLNSNVKTFCHNGDLICDGWPIPLPAHATYEYDAPAAAEYVASRL